MNGEYPPLLTAGFHDVDEDSLNALFVTSFPDPSPRRELVEGLRALLSVIRSIGIHCEVWLDGSFATQKPAPGDIDMAIYFDPIEVNQLNIQQKITLRELADTNLCKLRYGCDPYLIPNNSPEHRSYWRGWFGFNRNEEAKGIARLFV